MKFEIFLKLEKARASAADGCKLHWRKEANDPFDNLSHFSLQTSSST
jgi:hypothetical protein